MGSARAAACHLMVNKKDFRKILAMKKMCFSLMSISGLDKINKGNDLGKSNEVSNAIVERLLISIEESNMGTDTALLSCLGFSCSLSISTLATISIDPRHFLSVDCSQSDYTWDWSKPQLEVIDTLVSMSFSSLKIEKNSRCRAITLIKNLLEAEDSLGKGNVMKLCILQSFDKVEESHLQRLVCNDIFLQNSSSSNRQGLLSLSHNLCFIIVVAVGSTTDLQMSYIKSCKVILQSLMDNIDRILQDSNFKHILYLACVLAARLDMLAEIGTLMMSRALPDKVGLQGIKYESSCLVVLEIFFCFLCGKFICSFIFLFKKIVQISF